MLRVAFLTDIVFPNTLGGMARYCLHCAKELARLGARVSFVAAAKAPSEAQALHWKKELGVESVELVPWRSLPRFPAHYVVSNYLLSRKIRERLHHLDCDVTFAHGFTAWAYLRERRELRIPVVSHPHGLEPYQSLPTLRERVRNLPLKNPLRHICQNSDAVISYGREITTILRNCFSIPEERISEVPNAIDSAFLDSVYEARQRKIAKNDLFTFLFVGRYEPRKGVELLISAFTKLHGCHLRIIGPMPEQIRTRCARAARIEWVGCVTDLRALVDLYVSSDCLVIPSYAEGIPTVALEGMAAYLPIVATRVGALPGIWPFDSTLLVPPGDADSLAAAMSRVLDMPVNERDGLAFTGRQHVQRNFTWPVVAPRILEILRRVSGR